PGQHHVHHARDTDQSRDAYGTAAADKNAARALRERIVGLAFRDPHVGRGREFQTPADDGPVHHRDHRYLAELDLVEHAVPQARMANRLLDAVRAQVGEVETGGEMIAVAMQHYGFHAFGQVAEERLDPENGLVVKRVALLGAVEPQNRDLTAGFGVQGGWQ